MRREEELNIAKSFVLPQEVVTEFRIDLPVLYERFLRYNRRGDGTVSRQDLHGLLIDVGLCPFKPRGSSCEKMPSIDLIVDAWAKENTSFPVFLRIIHELRLKKKSARQGDLLEKFHSYDKYKLGELHYNDVYQILTDFKMLPR